MFVRPTTIQAEPRATKRRPADERIPVIILTGALGSGKTTLLNGLLREEVLSGAAVFVNEFGSIGVDHDIVREVSEDVVLLASGCLCCAVDGDLRDSLLSLAAESGRSASPFSGPAIIETSGLANPIPILQLLRSDEEVSKRFTPGPVVTVVDALSAGRADELDADTTDQIAVADIIHIAKTDLASASDQAAVSALLDNINPDAMRFDGTEPLELARRLVKGMPDNASGFRCLPAGTSPTHTAGIGSFVIEESGSVREADFVTWVQLLLQSQGERLLRVKGFTTIERGPVVVQGVGPLFHTLKPANEEAGSTRLVLIGRDLDASAISRSFKETCADTPASEEPASCLPPDSRGSPESLAGRLETMLAPHLQGRVCSALLWNVHNPWSIAGTRLPAWDLLELCEDQRLVGLVKEVLGMDVLLVETDVITGATPWLERTDGGIVVPALPLPVDPPGGLEIRIGLPLHRQSALNCQVAPAGESWRLDPDDEAVFVIRYASAAARFVREANHPANRMREALRPLAYPPSAPIFLVSGENRAGNNLAAGFARPRAEWL